MTTSPLQRLVTRALHEGASCVMGCAAQPAGMLLGLVRHASAHS
jgi:hypothetical protein